MSTITDISTISLKTFLRKTVVYNLGNSHPISQRARTFFQRMST